MFQGHILTTLRHYLHHQQFILHELRFIDLIQGLHCFFCLVFKNILRRGVEGEIEIEERESEETDDSWEHEHEYPPMVMGGGLQGDIEAQQEGQ